MPEAQDGAPAFGGLNTSFDANNEDNFNADVEMQLASNQPDGGTTATTGNHNTVPESDD
jgi:hypothetical protein